MNGKVQCLAGHWHFPALARLHVNCAAVANAVVHSGVVHKSRQGKYADPEARKVYRREWTRKDRAAKRAKEVIHV